MTPTLSPTPLYRGVRRCLDCGNPLVIPGAGLCALCLAAQQPPVIAAEPTDRRFDEWLASLEAQDA